MRYIIINNALRLLFIVFIMLGALGCKDFILVDPPGTSLTSNTVFMDEPTATAAILNIYMDMSRSDERPFSGEYSLSWMSGLMVDEFQSYFNDSRAEFAENKVNPENSIVQRNWTTLYEAIYGANIIIEQMEKSDKLVRTFRDGMEGEARFVRALMYFYLVNFWENVPLVLTTDYNLNRLLPQSTKEEIYVQIIEDLQKAQLLLGEQYLSSGRIRPNKFTAMALLAKVYLHTQEWEKAIGATTAIIGSGLYQLENDLNTVFLTTSKEVIWHLDAVYPNVYTWDAYRFVLIAAPTRVTVSNTLLEMFGFEDNRRTNWIGKFTTGGHDYYFPNKYKVRRIPDHIGASPEYFVMFRLAEQYLIRAEARVMSGDISGGIADLNTIRNRAGLEPLGLNNNQEVLDAILQERRLELFTEGCNRWFDLKRIGQVKSPTLPIPQIELNRNPVLIQNPGY